MLPTTFCSNTGLSSAAAGNAVDPRRPFDRDVGDRLLGGGMQGVQALGTAALHLFDQNAAVGETDDAELADQVRRHRIADLVVKDVPAIEIGAQAVATDLDGRHFLCGPGGPVDLVEIRLRHVVKMCCRTRSDVANHRHPGRWRLLSHWEWLAAGQQPFRRHPETPRVLLGVLWAIVAAARTLRSLVRAVGGHW